MKKWSRRGLAILLVILTAGIAAAGVILPGVVLKGQDASLLGRVKSAGADYYAGQQEVDVGEMTLDQKLLLTSGEWEREEVTLFSGNLFSSAVIYAGEQDASIAEQTYKNGEAISGITYGRFYEVSELFSEYLMALQDYYGRFEFSNGRVGVYQYTDTYLKRYVCKVVSISLVMTLMDNGYNGKVEAVFDADEGSLIRLCMRIDSDTEFYYISESSGEEEFDAIYPEFSRLMDQVAALDYGDWRDASGESYITCPLRMGMPDEDPTRSRKYVAAISDTCDYVTEYTPRTFQIYLGLRSDAGN